MFLRDLPRALLRRWYLVLLGLALSVVAAYLAWQQVGPRYTAENTTLMLPPVSATRAVPPVTEDKNPLLYLGGLAQARDVVIGALASDSVKEEFDQRFPATTFGITPAYSSNAPVIIVSVSAPTAARALEAAAYVTDLVEDEFLQVQVKLDIHPDEQIRSMPLTFATTATPDFQPAIRAAAVVGVGLAAASVFLVGVMDGLLNQRTRRPPAPTALPARAVGSRGQPAGSPGTPGAPTATAAVDEDAPSPNLEAIPPARARGLTGRP